MFFLVNRGLTDTQCYAVLSRVKTKVGTAHKSTRSVNQIESLSSDNEKLVNGWTLNEELKIEINQRGRLLAGDFANNRNN